MGIEELNDGKDKNRKPLGEKERGVLRALLNGNSGEYGQVPIQSMKHK